MHKSAYLILGMHRSGTSAATGVLAKLGVAMPKTTMPITKDNPKGYFESVRFMLLNDKLLQSAGSAWNDWRVISPPALSELLSPPAQDEIMQAVRDEFSGDMSIAIKDPRICRIAPPWIDALQTLGFQPLIVIPYRSPLEVSESLQVRDGMGPNESLLLWLRHILDAEHYSRGHPRAFVLMSDLLQAWQTVMEGIAQDTNAQFPLPIAEMKAEMDDFLDPQLKHFSADEDLSLADNRLSEWAKGVFKSIRALDKKQDIEKEQAYLDDIRERLTEAGELFYGFIQDIEQKADLHRRDAQLNADARAELLQQLTLSQQATIEQTQVSDARWSTDLAAQKAEYDALIESQMRTCETEKQALATHYAAEIENISAKHHALIVDNIRTCEAEKQALIIQYTTEIENINAKHHAQIVDNIRTCETEKQALIVHYTSEIENINVKHHVLIEDSVQTYETEKQTLATQYNTKIDDITHAHDEEISGLQISIKDLISDRDQIHFKHDELSLLLDKYRRANTTTFFKWAMDSRSRP